MNFPESVPVNSDHVARELTMPEAYGLLRRMSTIDLQRTNSIEQEDRLMDGYAEWWERNISEPRNLFIGIFAGKQIEGYVQLLRTNSGGSQPTPAVKVKTELFKDHDQKDHLLADAVKTVLANCDTVPSPVIIDIPHNRVETILALKEDGFEIATNRSESENFTLIRPA